MTKIPTYAIAGLLAFGVLMTPANTSAQIKPQGNKHLFRIKWVKGQSFNYKMTNTTAIPGMKSPEPMPYAYTMAVKSVSGGKATVEIKGKAAGAGAQTEPVTIDSRGKTTSKSQSSLFSSEMNQLPEKAVAIGESWTTSGEAPGMSGAKLTIKSTNTFKGFKTVNGKKMAHVHIVMALNGSGMSGKGSGDVLHEVSNGMTFRATIKMDMTASSPQNGEKMNIGITTKIERA